MKKLEHKNQIVLDCKLAGSVLAHVDYEYLYETTKDFGLVLDKHLALHVIDPVEQNRIEKLIHQYRSSAHRVWQASDRAVWMTKDDRQVSVIDIELFHAKNIHSILTEREKKLLHPYFYQDKPIARDTLIKYNYWITMCRDILSEKFKKEEAQSIMTELFSEDEANEKFDAFKNLLSNNN